ncbi:MAG TPA: hypothetical protein DDY14_07570 [Chromatiaceae bacterium]|nr:hypothetical protein [Chromatiaceae bacterium]
MRYTVILEQSATSVGAYVPDLPGCIAAADTKTEALQLIAEAIELPHRRLFIDPELAQNHIFLDTIERLHRSHQRSARIFDLIGVLALLMLLVTAFLGL